ncbi:MAG: hypothetical protein V4492_06905 [Chlamydiota bacterium]
MRKIFASLCVMALVMNSIEAQGMWGDTPITISTPGVAASAQQISLDPTGNATAVWIEDGFIVSKSLLFGGSWSASVTTLSGSGASDPQLVVDASGNATALWNEGGVIKTSTQLFGGSWQVTPDTVSGASASFGTLTADGSGNLVAVWLEGGVVLSSTKLFGGSWQVTPDTLSGSSATAPQVAVNAAGDVFAVWQQTVSAVETIYVATKTIGGSWGVPEAISTNTVDSGCPQIAVDPSGNALAAWYRFVKTGTTYSKVYAQASYYSAGGIWTSPMDLSNAGLMDPVELMLQVGFDAAGDAAVVWSNSADGSTFDMYASLLPVGGTWIQSGAFTLQDMLAYQFDSDVLADSVGVVYMTYNPYTNQIGIFSTYRFVPSNRAVWSIPAALTAPGAIGFPKMAAVKLPPSVYGIGLWLAYDGSNNVLQANLGTVDLVQPASNLAVQGLTNNFEVLSEPYNLITWDASPNAAGYRIYRNGLFWTEMGSTTLSTVDNNQSAPTVNTYTIYALDPNGGQSTGITVSYP